MLTLGLMEGVLTSAAGLMLLVGLVTGDAPMHRVLGPPVAFVVGFAAYLIHDSGEITKLVDVVGLGFFAFVGFFLPLGLMRAAWKDARRPAEAAQSRGAPAAGARGKRSEPRWGVIRPARAASDAPGEPQPAAARAAVGFPG